MKTCYALRHVPFESLGLLEAVLTGRGYALRLIDVPVDGVPSEADDGDLVVVLGGPIGAYEEHLYPFVIDELRLLERRLAHGRATLGICLGAQLMARALGARVYPGSEKEIGWGPLSLTSAGAKSGLLAVEGQHVLHWHGDTFDLPEGAALLASTGVTAHQAFQWNHAAIGLQFHLEVTPRELEAWYVGHAAELSQWGKRSIGELRREGGIWGPRLEPHALLAFGEMLSTVEAQ